MARIGIIGGSGLYNIEGLENKRWIRVDTPFGAPSDEYLIGTLEDEEIAFLPRHGRGHRLMPSELNYCANIYGMKKVGVEWIISVSTVGSFKKEIKPLDILIPDQFVDRTNQARRVTFFGDGIVAHIPFAHPVCPVLFSLLCKASEGLGVTLHKGGTYLNMEGPAFSTKAESLLYKSWGMDVIGMTNIPEARLSREAEICFATVAMVTDYDAWHVSQPSQNSEKKNDISMVTIDMIIQNLKKNAEKARQLIKTVIPLIPKERNCQCATALKDAIITVPDLIPEERKKELELIINKYIKTEGE
ncbi:MAG TPA: S-methyl-5'-thioadenosine phosphorylase [Candidatus Omnitrophica bacterium]|nr:S-methyl-5'-thioadenosine phosphorylase [Candidatus Omnitrophota bacterium]